jgi:hypothetical protein
MEENFFTVQSIKEQRIILNGTYLLQMQQDLEQQLMIMQKEALT